MPCIGAGRHNTSKKLGLLEAVRRYRCRGVTSPSYTGSYDWKGRRGGNTGNGGVYWGNYAKNPVYRPTKAQKRGKGKRCGVSGVPLTAAPSSPWY